MNKIRTPTALSPVHIDRDGLYFLSDLRRLGFGRDRIREARAAGELRYSVRCGKIVCLGEWLIEWVERGEVVRKNGEG